MINALADHSFDEQCWGRNDRSRGTHKELFNGVILLKDYELKFNINDSVKL